MEELMNIFHRIGTEPFHGIGLFIVNMLVAIISSFAIVVCNLKITSEKLSNTEGSTLIFPLLSIATTSIFSTLQFSIPLSLGLLGSLSIIRFRSPVKSHYTMVFLLIVIASSLLVSTSNYVPLLALIMTTFLVSSAVAKIRLNSCPTYTNNKGSVSIQVIKNSNFDLSKIDYAKINKLFKGNFKLKSISEDNGNIYLNAHVVFTDKFDIQLVNLKELFPIESSFSIFYEDN